MKSDSAAGFIMMLFWTVVLGIAWITCSRKFIDWAMKHKGGD